MAGWIRTNRGKKQTTYYIVIPWDRMDGSVKRKNWQLPYDERGNRFESKAHAVQTLEFFRVLIRSGKFNPLDWIEAKPHALEKLVPDYLKEYRAEVDRGHISPSTLDKKRRDFDKHILPFFQGMDVKHIVNLDVGRFYQQLPKLKAKTLLNIMSELKQFFSWCAEEGVIGKAPRFTKMKDLRRQAKEQRPPVREATHVMPKEDFDKAVGKMHPADRPVFRFIRDTGCRPSEARALQRNDLDWLTRVGEIRRTWVDIKGQSEVLVERAKSGSDHPFYLTDQLIAVIKSVPPKLDHPFVFWNHKTGKPYTRREIDYRWRTALKKAEVPHMPLKNATRAHAICELLKLGYSYAEAGGFVGHKNESTTRVYGQIFMDSVKDMAERQPKANNQITTKAPKDAISS